MNCRWATLLRLRPPLANAILLLIRRNLQSVLGTAGWAAICNLPSVIHNLQSIRGCMSARKKRWVLRDPAPADFIASLHDRSPLAATLLYQRGLRDQPSIAAFLSTDYKSGFHDP